MSGWWECGGVGFPTKARTVHSLGHESTGHSGIVNLKRMHSFAGWEGAVPTVLHSPPPPQHLYSTEPSWKHILFSLVLWSWLMPESQGQAMPQNSWNSAQWLDQTEQEGQEHLLQLVLLLPDLNQYLSAALCSQSLSVSWCRAGVGRKRPAGRVTSLGMKHFQGWEIQAFISTAQFECFISNILSFQQGALPTEKSLGSPFKIFHTVDLPTFP